MTGIDRTQHVLLPFRAQAASSDRRRKRGETRPFEIEPTQDIEETPTTATVPPRTLSSGGDEGVGEFVNIVV